MSIFRFKRKNINEEGNIKCIQMKLKCQSDEEVHSAYNLILHGVLKCSNVDASERGNLDS